MLTGFRATADLSRLGYHVLALVRLRYPTGNSSPLPGRVLRQPQP